MRDHSYMRRTCLRVARQVIRRPRHARGVLLAVSLAGALLPTAAPSNALASYAFVSTSSGNQLVYYAEFSPDDYLKPNNQVGISGAKSYTVSDFTPDIHLALGPGCARGSGGDYQAICQAPSRIEMFLGDGDDRGAAIVGIQARMHGETGNDRLTGGESHDLLFGGSGDDSLHGSGGHDQLKGEGGSDLLIGGAGFDYADYSDYTAPVTVTLNGLADDGAEGEAGNADTEGVQGGSAGDTLTGHNRNNDSLIGRAGDDVLEGLGGQDSLSGVWGDDTIWALDGEEDNISCGDGFDVVLADWKDYVNRDCEDVSRV